MKKVIVLAFAGAAIIVTSAFSVLHSSGMTLHTGSPYDGATCSSCHSGGSTTPTVTITANPAFGTGNTYTPGTAYTVSVNCSGTYPKYGFDLEILNSTSSTSALDAGTFGTIVTSNCKKVVTSGQPTNITHTVASGSSNAATFSFHWTAPNSGTAYLYCAGLGVNNNGSTSGDKVKTASLTLTPSNVPLSVAITNTLNVKCNGGSTGTATVTASGGTTPYSYSWNNGQTNQTATGLAVGTYTVTVNGTATATVTITQPPALATSMNATSSSTCSASDGSVTATVSGGASPYTYSWSNGHTTAAITGLAAGSYTLTVTDANLCTLATVATVGCLGSTLAVTITNTVNVKCFGGNTGTAKATATGGTTPYTYSWSNGQTTQIATGLLIGTYTVTVNGAATATVSITQAPLLTTIMNATSASSCTATDGNVTAAVSGGVTPYSYLWSNSNTTAAITALAAGSYTLTVTDANLCTKTTVATVNCSNGGFVDAGISSVGTPVDTICSATFTPVVNLKSFGTSILTSCKILYHTDANPVQMFNWNGSLSIGASVNVTLPSMTVSSGAHTFTSASSIPNGSTDGNSSNDQTQHTFYITGSSAALPILEGFESSANFPTGWTLFNPDNDAAWQVVTTVAHTGTSCIGFDNCDGNGSGGNMTGKKDRFITPAYNLSNATTSASLSFDLAYALLDFKGQINSDTLAVFSSTDCGSTWSQLYLKGGAALATVTATTAQCWVPSANEWRTENISLTNFAGSPSVMFAFENRSDWGEWIYLDNININAVTIAGIESVNSSAGFNIYPNPAVASFTIEGASNAERIHFVLYDVVGTEVKTGDIANKGIGYSEKIQVSDISKGIYFINVSDGKNTWTKKLSVR